MSLGTGYQTQQIVWDNLHDLVERFPVDEITVGYRGAKAPPDDWMWSVLQGKGICPKHYLDVVGTDERFPFVAIAFWGPDSKFSYRGTRSGLWGVELAENMNKPGWWHIAGSLGDTLHLVRPCQADFVAAHRSPHDQIFHCLQKLYVENVLYPFDENPYAV